MATTPQGFLFLNRVHLMPIFSRLPPSIVSVVVTLVAIPSALAGKSIVTLDFSSESRISTFEAPLSSGLSNSLKSFPQQTALDDKVVKQGASSLRWSWNAGDELHFKIPPFDSTRTTGPYSSWRPSVLLWLHTDEAQEAPLILATDAATAAARKVPISLEHAAVWQRQIISYVHHLGVPAGTVPQHVILTAPEKGSGILHIDLASFDMQFPEDRGHWQKPGAVAATLKETADLYQKVDAAFTPSEGRQPTPAEITRVETIERELVRGGDRKPGDPASAAADMARQLEQFSRQNWLTRNRIGTYASSELKTHYGLPGEKTLIDAQNQIARAAALHGQLEAGSDARQQLGGAVIRYINYCEYQLGVDFIIPSGEVVKLRDLLVHHQLFERYVARCFAVSADFFNRLVLPDPRMQGNIEALGWGGGEFPVLLRSLYLLKDEAKIALAMRALQTGINNAIFPASTHGGYLDDGTVNHHGVPNWAYGGYCMPGFYDQLGNSYTRYQFLGQDRLDYMKRVLMRAEGFSAGIDVPFVLRARWLEARSTITPRSFKAFALHGHADGSIDADAAGAYLNLVPAAAAEEPLSRLGVKARPVPAQTFAMPWSCLLVHRDDGFLATVKGFNTQVAAFEMQGSNRLARYLSHGFLQISNNRSGGDKLSFEDSGFSFAGLDWSHLPGTTSKPLPYDQLHRNLGRARGTESFAGGLASASRDGIFAMKLRDIVDRTFTARKSYFFFGPRIICLGSDIHADDTAYPIHTTLFQKHLKTPDQPVHFNGSPVTGFPAETSHPASASPGWLLDPQGLGYVLPEGQSVTLRRSRQISHAASSGDQTLGPANEADQVVCWIDHGPAPRNAGYEYTILINRPAAEVESYALALAGEPSKRPYRVLQKNTAAHVLQEGDSGAIAYAIFEPGQPLPEEGIIRSSSNSFLALQRESGRGFTLTLCDPVLRQNPATPLVDYIPATTTLTLSGAWTAGNPPPNVSLRTSGDDTETEVIFTATDGSSVELELVPR